VSTNAHLIAPYHRALDKVTARYLGSARIGTTGRGIGPAYGDKIARVGIRVQDLFDPGILRKKLELVLREKKRMLSKVCNRRGIDPAAVAAGYAGYAERLRPYVADTGARPRPGLGPGPGGAARGCPGHHAGRGPRHPPVRDLLLVHRGRRGGGPLHGTVFIQGAKNAGLKMIAASLLTGTATPCCATRWANGCARGARNTA